MKDQPKQKPRGSDVDIEKLKADNPNDPRIGQGYNDARGEVSDPEGETEYRNNKNNLRPVQKKDKSRPQ